MSVQYPSILNATAINSGGLLTRIYSGYVTCLQTLILNALYTPFTSNIMCHKLFATSNQFHSITLTIDPYAPRNYGDSSRCASFCLSPLSGGCFLFKSAKSSPPLPLSYVFPSQNSPIATFHKISLTG
jgi:hypothetical protein